jgi:uncharacterized membrane protein (DUF441 family)
VIIISIAIIIVNKPYFLNFDKIDANPKNMNERGVKVKNIIETYKCIFPEVSGNIPIARTTSYHSLASLSGTSLHSC